MSPTKKLRKHLDIGNPTNLHEIIKENKHISTNLFYVSVLAAPQIDLQDVKLKEFVHLLKGCLVPEPSERLAPEDALQHHFLRSVGPWISFGEFCRGYWIDVEGDHLYPFLKNADVSSLQYVPAWDGMGSKWWNKHTIRLDVFSRNNGDKLPWLDHFFPHRWVWNLWLGDHDLCWKR